MSRARAIALMTAALVGGVGGCPGSARADQPCPPAVVVVGDGQLARELSAQLARRGVKATARTGCSRVTAKVRREGELVHVEVTDGYGRSRTWDIRDVGTVSALIESWTRQEADERELLPEEPDEATAAAPRPVVSVVPSGTVSAPIAAAVTVRPRTRGGASFAVESAITGDSSWLGASLDSCVRLGAVCAGGRIRAARSTPTHHDMTAVDLLATLELPLEIGGFTIAPGAALGVGWTRVTSDDPHALAPTLDIGGVRAGAQLTVGRRLVAGISIDLSASFDGALLGQGGAPAALPSALARVGLGLRYGRR